MSVNSPPHTHFASCPIAHPTIGPSRAYALDGRWRMSAAECRSRWTRGRGLEEAGVVVVPRFLAGVVVERNARQLRRCRVRRRVRVPTSDLRATAERRVVPTPTRGAGQGCDSSVPRASEGVGSDGQPRRWRVRTCAPPRGQSSSKTSRSPSPQSSMKWSAAPRVCVRSSLTYVAPSRRPVCPQTRQHTCT